MCPGWIVRQQEEESKVESLSEESGIRGRNELADIREEPVYSRPTFPGGTSNLNFSHQNEASSSSGSSTRWDHPTCPAPVVTNRIHRLAQRVILTFVLFSLPPPGRARSTTVIVVSKTLLVLAIFDNVRDCRIPL